MHVRFTACAGLAVVDDTTEDILGVLLLPLIHPDRGTIEGFFVSIPRFLSSETTFVSVVDIVHWGVNVRVRNSEDLGPLSERMRLQAFVDEGRLVMGQKMMTESGVLLGTCKDIQFNTKTFVVEWLFPRKLLRWGIAVPVSAIIEVKEEAVILRDVVLGKEVEVKGSMIPSLEELTKVPTAGMTKQS